MQLNDGALSELENAILVDPEVGDIIEGTGGARKMRISLNGRGKSGGGRVIYFDIRETVFLFTAYPKNVQEDLNPNQKKQLKALTHAIRKERV